MAAIVTRVLLVGATGFIGGTVLEALRVRPLTEIWTLVRKPGAVAESHRVTPVRGDLRWPTSLNAACIGVDTVIHTASYLGPDASVCNAVNTIGTGALVNAARSAGVQRIIQVGTAAVHGRGPHHNTRPASTPTRPQSAVSATRLAGEQLVRAAGGIVVRPHLIYGEGDRWVVPALVKLITAGDLQVGNPTALHSLVHVAELARAVVGLIDTPDEACPPGTVLGGGHPVPTTTAEVLATVRNGLNLSAPTIPQPIDQHDTSLLASDHWFASTELWQLTGVDPGPAFPDGFQRCAAWYRTAVLGG